MPQVAAEVFRQHTERLGTKKMINMAALMAPKAPAMVLRYPYFSVNHPLEILPIIWPTRGGRPVPSGISRTPTSHIFWFAATKILIEAVRKESLGRGPSQLRRCPYHSRHSFLLYHMPPASSGKGDSSALSSQDTVGPA
jgi:hypothetical protein